VITLGAIQEILGWCTIINFGLLLLTSIALSSMRDTIVRVHSKMYSLSEQDLSRAYFQYLAQYKIVIIVFNLAPYIALRIVT